MAKIDIPDGNGGWKQVEATEFTAATKPDRKTQTNILSTQATKDRMDRITRATEACINILTAYGTEQDLSTDELGAAMYLAVLNYRQFYPEDKGGIEAFDSICADIATYFKANLPK